MGPKTMVPLNESSTYSRFHWLKWFHISKFNRVSTYRESTVSKIPQKVSFLAITLRKTLHEIFGTV